MLTWRTRYRARDSRPARRPPHLLFGAIPRGGNGRFSIDLLAEELPAAGIPAAELQNVIHETRKRCSASATEGKEKEAS
jgi:hypothetical protein